MTTRKPPTEKVRRGRPASTPEGREKQLVGLAVDLAERQMREGTASSQVITHYLKLGSTREQLEQERLAKENRLLDAKMEQMATAGRIEELYEAAIDAMRTYAGQDPIDRQQDDECVYDD